MIPRDKTRTDWHMNKGVTRTFLQRTHTNHEAWGVYLLGVQQRREDKQTFLSFFFHFFFVNLLLSFPFFFSCLHLSLFLSISIILHSFVYLPFYFIFITSSLSVTPLLISFIFHYYNFLSIILLFPSFRSSFFTSPSPSSSASHRHLQLLCIQ